MGSWAHSTERKGGADPICQGGVTVYLDGDTLLRAVVTPCHPGGSLPGPRWRRAGGAGQKQESNRTMVGNPESRLHMQTGSTHIEEYLCVHVYVSDKKPVASCAREGSPVGARNAHKHIRHRN